MEERASIPPGLPRSNPTESYWQSTGMIDTIADHRTTSELPESADVVIIGSGISGASIAFNILDQEPTKRVIVLEARQACSGASGRNGGHTKGASYRTFMENTQNLGAEEAIKIAQLEYNCMRAVHSFAREHDIDCDSKELDTVDVIYDQGQWDQAMEAIQLMRKLMKESDPAREYQIHTSEESQEKFLVPGAIGCISYAAGSLSAYKFGVGVLQLGLERGLNLQTNTPVSNISFDKTGGGKGGWMVQSQRGAILAEKVVLASNGYTAHVYPRLLGTICPLRGQVTAHRPGSRLPKSGLANTYSFIYKDGYEYMIPRPQGSRFAGDIVIGGGLTKAVEAGLYEYGNTDDTCLNQDISVYLRDTTVTYFGNNWGDDAQEGRIRQEWTGIMGYSPDGYPLVGYMPDEEGLYISASFQGHGMVLALLCAKALTTIMLEGHGSELDLWFPEAFKVQRDRLALRFQGKGAHVSVKQDEKL